MHFRGEVLSQEQLLQLVDRPGKRLVQMECSPRSDYEHVTLRAPRGVSFLLAAVPAAVPFGNGSYGGSFCPIVQGTLATPITGRSESEVPVPEMQPLGRGARRARGHRGKAVDVREGSLEATRALPAMGRTSRSTLTRILLSRTTTPSLGSPPGSRRPDRSVCVPLCSPGGTRPNPDSTLGRVLPRQAGLTTD